jgi:hypothetical protein
MFIIWTLYLKVFLICIFPNIPEEYYHSHNFTCCKYTPLMQQKGCNWNFSKLFYCIPFLRWIWWCSSVLAHIYKNTWMFIVDKHFFPLIIIHVIWKLHCITATYMTHLWNKFLSFPLLFFRLFTVICSLYATSYCPIIQ